MFFSNSFEVGIIYEMKPEGLKLQEPRASPWEESIKTVNAA
jgi:hypothetical protein